jgi:hypothetical protein
MSRGQELLDAVHEVGNGAQTVRDMIESWGIGGTKATNGAVRSMDIASIAATLAVTFVEGELDRLPEQTVGVRRGHFIVTVSGGRFWVLDPRAEDVRVTDVCHALAFKCRWGAGCRVFYSVAEHSLNVGRIARMLAEVDGFPDPELAGMYGTIHDGEEAYLPDIPRPVKAMLKGWPRIAARVQDAVQEAFHLPPPPAEIVDYVHRADSIALVLESRLLFDDEARRAFEEDPHFPRCDVPAGIELLPMIGAEFHMVRAAFGAKLDQIMERGLARMDDAPPEPTQSEGTSSWRTETEETGGGGTVQCRVCKGPGANALLQLCSDCA